MRTIIGFVCAAFVLVSTTSAEVIDFQTCPNAATACAIHQVRVLPCPDANRHKPCKLKRGRTFAIEFDYTPDFDANTAISEVYWASPEGDIPFAGMNRAACEHTTCPLQRTTKNLYTYSLLIDKKYPAQTFDIKWFVRNGNTDEQTEEQCCAFFTIKIVK